MSNYGVSAFFLFHRNNIIWEVLFEIYQYKILSTLYQTIIIALLYKPQHIQTCEVISLISFIDFLNIKDESETNIITCKCVICIIRYAHFIYMCV